MEKIPEIKGVVFDLGGVIVSSRSFLIFLRNSWSILNALNISVNQLRATIPEEASLLERGKETSLQFLRRICKKLGIDPLKGNQLYKLWINAYRQNFRFNEPVLAIVKALNKSYPLAIVSNTIDDHVSVLKKQRRLLGYFDAVIFSNEVGFRKPQKEIFLLAARKMRIPPKNLIFIDDDIRWVRAAQALGFTGIKFISARQLRLKLKRLGVL